MKYQSRSHIIYKFCLNKTDDGGRKINMGEKLEDNTMEFYQ